MSRFSRYSWRPLRGSGSPFSRTHLSREARSSFPSMIRRPQAALKVGVALGHEAVQDSVLDYPVGHEQPPGKGVHAPDVGVEQVDPVQGAAPDLGVEVEPARAQPALAEHHQHALGREQRVGGELVGVPAQEQVAHVGVDAAQPAVRRGHGQVVLKGVPGQGGVVGLDVELEVVLQAVGLEKAQDRGRVKVVLVLGRLLGLGLDQKLAGEAD